MSLSCCRFALYVAVPWVWIGLKKGNLELYSDSNLLFLSAVTGSGCRSSSSVGGGYFSGRIRCRKDTGSCVSLAVNNVRELQSAKQERCFFCSELQVRNVGHKDQKDLVSRNSYSHIRKNRCLRTADLSDHFTKIVSVSELMKEGDLPIHVSDMTRMKYCGGSGSNTGTKNLTVCSSCENLLFSRKYSWCKITSLSTSSTTIQKACKQTMWCTE